MEHNPELLSYLDWPALVGIMRTRSAWENEPRKARLASCRLVGGPRSGGIAPINVVRKDCFARWPMAESLGCGSVPT